MALIEPSQLSLSMLSKLTEQLNTVERLVQGGFPHGANQELQFLRKYLNEIRVVSSKKIKSD